VKRVTIKDVARVAGVSYTTVSRALSGSSDIGEETRKRIIQISQEMGYSPNTVARSLVAQETKTIGLVINNISSPFTSEVTWYIEEQAWFQGYSLILCNACGSVEKEQAAVELLIGRQVDGIIMHPTDEHSYQRILPYTRTTPTVFINEDMGGLPASYVTIDNYKGGWMGTEYLHSLGHREIVYFGRRRGKRSRTLRAQGYSDACRHFGLTPRFVDYPYAVSTSQQSYDLARELFSKGQNFTAVFAHTDVMALSVLRAADAFGVRVPEDFSLLGFNNIVFSALPKINLTTIEQPKQAIAATAVTMLLERMKFPNTEHKKRVLIPSLVIRDSCRRIDLPLQGVV
jgi:LacI family transcriptional regulator